LTGISTRALKGADATYTALEDKIEGITDKRNKIGGRKRLRSCSKRSTEP
jgi:hypothetical protein